MKKYLILVKHSAPQIELDRPANTWKLSQVGQARAHRLAEELKSFKPEILISSVEPKARETAEIIASHLLLDMQILPDLHEHDRSNVPFLSHEEFQLSIREFFKKPDEVVFGKETANQVHTRFYRALHSVLSENRNKTVAIVTHGTVISLFVSRLTGSSDLELWNQLGLPSFIAMDLDSNTLVVKNTIL